MSSLAESASATLKEVPRSPRRGYDERGGRLETRRYFVFGDLLSTCFIGGAVGGVTSLLVQDGWPMPVGMIAGMVLGMVLSLLLSLLFVPAFGALEIMLPSMLAGMVSGMVCGMAVAAGALSGLAALGAGAGCGFVVVVYTYLLNARVGGGAI